ncbi:zf-RVT domain-containing protein [Cephalotus follicularis]|uniref:Zf-RVT domain-containing protein n=1 Tax=Cephalotus follicularis TaxID=3775 RepID=A0A1Q3CQW2_CEPFO|nr:zf-RVT domain-containing protein [Cephalotus follicularis]
MQVFWCKTFVLSAVVFNNCEWIIRSFLWFGVGDVKRAGKVTWDKVCHPKDEGGLGIKSLRAWNKAAILQQGWDIIKKKESVWVQRCYKVLIKNQNFWTVNITNQCSWSWRKILQMRECLAERLVFSVSDGDRIALWMDPWFRGHFILSEYGSRVVYDARIPFNAKLSAVIRNGQWDWPTDTWELQVISSITQSVPIEAGGDGIHWITKGKGFSCKIAWQSIILSMPKAIWADIVWFPNCIPKHSFCLWLTFHNAHRTTDKLQKFGVVASNPRVFGCGGSKSIDHLFFECSYTTGVWT